jgi:probable F420-dependent oxidoreductase
VSATDTKPFRFAANVPAPIGRPDEWRARVERIEALGFSSLAIADHFTESYTLEPFTALAAAAMCTSRIRLLTAVAGNDYRHPVQLHRSAAMVDVLSAGRLELGVGAGWMKSDYDAAGLRFDRPGVRIDRLEETITILKGLFAAAPLIVVGDHFSVNHLVGQPACVQRPHPPLMIGGGRPRVLRLAGRHADIVSINANLAEGEGAHAVLDVSREQVARKLTWVREGAEAAGRTMDDIELSMAQWYVRVTSSPADRSETLGRLEARLGLSPDQLVQLPGLLVGSVEELVDKLVADRDELGISYILVDAGPRSSPAIEAFAPVLDRLSGR